MATIFTLLCLILAIVTPSRPEFGFSSMFDVMGGDLGCSEFAAFVKLAKADKRRAWPETTKLSQRECSNPLLRQLLVLLFMAVAT